MNKYDLFTQYEKLNIKRKKILRAYRLNRLSIKRFHKIYDKLLQPTISYSNTEYLSYRDEQVKELKQ